MFIDPSMLGAINCKPTQCSLAETTKHIRPLLVLLSVFHLQAQNLQEDELSTHVSAPLRTNRVISLRVLNHVVRVQGILVLLPVRVSGYLGHLSLSTDLSSSQPVLIGTVSVDDSLWDCGFARRIVLFWRKLVCVCNVHREKYCGDRENFDVR